MMETTPTVNIVDPSRHSELDCLNTTPVHHSNSTNSEFIERCSIRMRPLLETKGGPSESTFTDDSFFPKVDCLPPLKPCRQTSTAMKGPADHAPTSSSSAPIVDAIPFLGRPSKKCNNLDLMDDDDEEEEDSLSTRGSMDLQELLNATDTNHFAHNSVNAMSDNFCFWVKPLQNKTLNAKGSMSLTNVGACLHSPVSPGRATKNKRDLLEDIDSVDDSHPNAIALGSMEMHDQLYGSQRLSADLCPPPKPVRQVTGAHNAQEKFEDSFSSDLSSDVCPPTKPIRQKTRDDFDVNGSYSSPINVRQRIRKVLPSELDADVSPPSKPVRQMTRDDVDVIRLKTRNAWPSALPVDSSPTKPMRRLTRNVAEAIAKFDLESLVALDISPPSKPVRQVTLNVNGGMDNKNGKLPTIDLSDSPPKVEPSRNERYLSVIFDEERHLSLAPPGKPTRQTTTDARDVLGRHCTDSAPKLESNRQHHHDNERYLSVLFDDERHLSLAPPGKPTRQITRDMRDVLGTTSS